MLFFAPPADLVVHHLGDYPFNIAQMCWFAAGHYHPPRPALRLFRRKRYPFRAVATAEQGDAGPDFPARRVRIETFLREDFAVGTASTPFCGGEQTMSYFCLYRRRAPAADWRDLGTVFTKLVVNDDLPGLEQTAREAAPAGAEANRALQPQAPKAYANAGEVDCVTSRANTLALQDGPTALLLTHPHLALGGPAGDGIIAGTQGTPLRRLSELVVFPAHHGGADELLVGGESRDGWAGEVPHGAWVVCRRGRLLIGVRPLACSRTLGPVRLSLETAGRYEFLRARFYEGVERRFSREELRHVFGGFVAEHASVDDFPSLAEFAAALAAGRFTDYFWTTRRVRYRRGALGPATPLEVEVSWSPGSHLPRIAAVNGRTVDLSVRAAYSGVRERDLPFLGEPFRSVPGFFPWADFQVEWGDWPWAIADRESQEEASRDATELTLPAQRGGAHGGSGRPRRARP
jgi:hypothetical protein